MALDGEIWAEEQVSDGQQQQFSQWPSFGLINIFVYTLEQNRKADVIIDLCYW